MKILIDGTGNYNKGAELMLLAILNETNKILGENIQYYFGRGKISNDRLKELQMIQYNAPGHFKLMYYNLPFIKIPQKYEMDILLDASGFRYGDFWDKKRTIYFNLKEYLKYRFLKKLKVKIIFLPQAYGPFNKPLSKLSAKTILHFSDIIIARDHESYNHIKKYAKVNDRIKVFPDFTNLLKLQKKDILNEGICIIPNIRINQIYNEKKSQIYYDFLMKTILHFSSLNMKVFILNHSKVEDIELCKKLVEPFKDNKVSFINLDDPLEIKKFIGNCQFVISSRYHGTINSLSQGVPTACVGWSHKYEYLMKDYNQLDALINISSVEEMLSQLKVIFNAGELNERRKNINEKADEQKKLANKMWTEIAECAAG